MPTPKPHRAAALLALALACAPSPEPAPDAEADTALVPPASSAAAGAIRTDREAYGLASGELVVVATYHNASADTVFVRPCGTRVPLWELEARQGDAWTRALSPACTMIAAPPLGVAPGAERTDTLRIAGAPGSPAVPRLEAGQVPGTFRLTYAVGARRDGEFGVADPLPVERRASNAFRIE